MLGQFLRDFAEVLTGKVYYYCSVFLGVGGGTAAAIVGRTADVQTMSTVALLVLEYGGLVTLLAGVSVIVKNFVDVAISIIDARRRRKK